MNIVITGINMSITDAIRATINKKSKKILARFPATDFSVSLKANNHLIACNIQYMNSGGKISASASNRDGYVAINQALNRLTKELSVKKSKSISNKRSHTTTPEVPVLEPTTELDESYAIK